jgi:hypothetical protein
MKTAKEFPNTTSVTHANLFQSTSILYDKKHLSDKGFRIFAKNLKMHIMEPIRKEQTLNQNHIPIQPSDLIPNHYLSTHRIIHPLTPQLQTTINTPPNAHTMAAQAT